MTDAIAGPPSSANAALRPLLFGDVPMDQWPVGDETLDDTAAAFVRARKHLADGDQDLAIREWAKISGFDTESRNILQAWTFLRAVNVHPDEAIAGEVLGVVVEVPVDGAHDVLAAYADGSVRYLNHAGGATILDTVPAEVAATVPPLLAAGQALADQIGVWEMPALPPLPLDHTRLCMLTRGGHRFGQGPDGALQAQPGATELFSAATELLVAVVALS